MFRLLEKVDGNLNGTIAQPVQALKALLVRRLQKASGDYGIRHHLSQLVTDDHIILRGEFGERIEHSRVEAEGRFYGSRKGCVVTRGFHVHSSNRRDGDGVDIRPTALYVKDRLTVLYSQFRERGLLTGALQGGCPTGKSS
jgi:hypothetical protein